MIYKATVELYIEVEDEASACDAVAETLRPLLRAFDPTSCIIDWNHARQFGVPSPTPASADEILNMEYDVEGNQRS